MNENVAISQHGDEEEETHEEDIDETMKPDELEQKIINQVEVSCLSNVETWAAFLVLLWRHQLWP
jgi:hypothetical protein